MNPDRSGCVVVAGEALIDLAPNADGTLVPLLGGAPYNTARALGRLGQPTAFIGSLSRDRFGARLAAALAAEGVLFDERLRTDRPTSLAMAEFDEAGAASYRFYFAGTSAESLQPEAALNALPENVSALFIGGLGLVLEPLAQAVEALLERLSGAAPVMVDPNVRPALIRDRERYKAHLERILARAEIVKVSDDDLRFLAPHRSIEVSAQDLLAQGPKLVLLTLGAEGAVAFGTFGVRPVAAPRVTVVDTIGAGDTFSGAWLTHWLRLGGSVTDAEAVRDATAFACHAAALSCTRAGASPPTLEESLQNFPRR